MAEALHEDARPPVPGFWRLGWLLFMQPLTLHRLFADWELEDDPSLWKLRGRLREGDPVVRALVARLICWLLLVMPVSTMVIVGCLDLAGLHVAWKGVAGSIAGGIAGGIAGVVAFAVAGGVAGGVAFAIAGGIFFAVAGEVAGGFAYAIAFAVAIGTTIGVILNLGAPNRIDETLDFIIPVCVVVCIAGGLGGGISGVFTDSPAGGVVVGVAVGIVFGIAFLLTFLQVPIYPMEVILTAVLNLAARLRLASLPRLADSLPYRHHEPSYFPLPFLAGFLIRLGEEHPTKGRRALAEAAALEGQREPARRALVELQARSLERAAREKQYAGAAALALPFLSGLRADVTAAQSGYLAPIEAISTAARDLEAARSTTSHHQRRQALTRARKELQRALDRTTVFYLTREEQRFLPVVKGWLDRVADEETALATLEQERPQVPLVFVAGLPLTPANESLFRGRTDLVRLLDQDLAAERPVPLVLLGQRRMGKSTLLNFLPRLLGTGTRVVRLDFQGLSGHPLRGEPHRWVAVEVAAALTAEGIAAASQPPDVPPWGATLDWLAALEEPLSTAGRRLLIALDEVEGLERGIRESWSDPAFLDFLRAAGDRLHRSRFLLVTAHPFSRLGPHWSDRLISAQTRRIDPLGEQDARDLLTRPIEGFPSIYPEGGVEHLLAMTACHPYLLQLTAYQLTRRLNDAGRLKATGDDLTAALDQALEENNLFQYLWNDLSGTQRHLIAALARKEELPEMTADDRRDLAREQLIRQDGNGGWTVVVPLFARWIREIGAAG